jgi:hypothetical protein
LTQRPSACQFPCSRPHFVAAALVAPTPALPPPSAQAVFDCQCRSLPPLGSGVPAVLPLCASCRSYPARCVSA